VSNTSISPSAGSASLAGIALSMGLALAPGGASLALNSYSPPISPVAPQAATTDAGESLTATWTGLQNGFIGAPTPSRLSKAAAIQVTGVFGSGGSIKIQGSNDAINWADVSASPLTATTGAGFFAALNALPRYLRPNVTAGDSTTSLNVTAVLT
jgi:hypothetical protein